MDFLGISGPEAIIIAVVVLVVLGPKGMSEAARRILEVRRRWLEVSASFRSQSDQAMAQLRAYAPTLRKKIAKPAHPKRPKIQGKKCTHLKNHRPQVRGADS